MCYRVPYVAPAKILLLKLHSDLDRQSQLSLEHMCEIYALVSHNIKLARKSQVEDVKT